MSFKAINREHWLTEAVACLEREVFGNYSIPSNLRVSCGLPSKGAFSTKKRTVGQCWDAEATIDKHFEIYISPVLSDPLKVLATLVHEIVHAVAGIKAKHRGAFKKIAKDVGLEGKMTATVAGERLTKTLMHVAEELGVYPMGALHSNEQEKKQSTRMIKLECTSCGYIVRTTKKWIELGLPVCQCGTQFEADDSGEEGGE